VKPWQILVAMPTPVHHEEGLERLPAVRPQMLIAKPKDRTAVSEDLRSLRGELLPRGSQKGIRFERGAVEA